MEYGILGPLQVRDVSDRDAEVRGTRAVVLSTVEVATLMDLAVFRAGAASLLFSLPCKLM